MTIQIMEIKKILENILKYLKNPNLKEVNSNTIIYAIAIALILGIIAGYGTFERQK